MKKYHEHKRMEPKQWAEMIQVAKYHFNLLDQFKITASVDFFIKLQAYTTPNMYS